MGDALTTDASRPPALISLSADYAAAVLAAVVLTVLALHHEFQTSSEFIAAVALVNPEHEWVVTPLYGSLLYGTHRLVGDVLLAGGLMSVFGGLGCVVAGTRLLGPWAGLWLLAQVGFLLAATVPGPNILVLMCVLWGVYASQQEQRGIRTGLFLLVAYLLAEWSWPIALGVVFISRSRPTVLVVYALGILSVWYGEGRIFPLPDLDIGSIRTSLYVSVRALISDWVMGVGVLALMWGSVRGNRASRFLLLLAIIQTVSLSVGVGEPEQLVVAQSFVVLGIAAVETGPALLLLSLILLGVRLPAVLDGTDRHRAMVTMIRATAGSPEQALCTSSDFVRPTLNDGWVRPCLSLETMSRMPSEIHPIHIRQQAAASQSRLFVTEDAAILHTYPWLQDFLESPYPEGFVLIEQSKGWKVFSVSL